MCEKGFLFRGTVALDKEIRQADALCNHGLWVGKSAYVLAGHCAEKGLLQESNNLERQGNVPRTTNYDKGWMVQPAEARANQIFWTCPEKNIT